jgi:hypothetical protein
MVELQLEKLSPLPVTHIVWSVYLMPRPQGKTDTLQTVIVIIASRSAVEEFLGQLESQGFVADRLEAPGLDQLLTVNMHEDGVWIVPGAPGEPALVAWSLAGTIHNVTLVTLPPGPERGPQLRTQVEHIAWAGELEGWLPGPPRVHLVAAPADAAFWEPIFKDEGELIAVVPPIAESQLVAKSAQRCANASSTSLLPPEFAKRYRQQFTDSLWIRGAFSLLGLYIIGVLIYFGALYALKINLDKEKVIFARVNQANTEANKDRAQLQILEQRNELKFAALDCWKAVAVNLPEHLTIDTMYFDRQKLELQGTAPSSDSDFVNTFNEALRHAPNPSTTNKTLFVEVSPPNISINQNQSTAQWRFSCKLNERANE